MYGHAGDLLATCQCAAACGRPAFIVEDGVRLSAACYLATLTDAPKESAPCAPTSP